MRLHFKTLQRTFYALTLACAGSMAMGAQPAQALVDNYIFGNSYLGNGSQELVLTGTSGTTVIQADNTGWYRSDGHTAFPGNTDYIAGDCSSCGNYNFRNFFNFDLSSVTGTITGASLSIFNPSTGYAGAPSTFIVHDANALATALLSGTSSTSTYNAMTTGSIFGSAGVSSATNNSNVIVNLNPFALASINSLEGQSFTVAGRLGTLAVIPLPAGLPMFAFALLAMFAAVQFSRKRKLA